MSDMMRYKGYDGSVKYSDEDGLFYGKLEFIKALITYEGTDVKSLRDDFHEAVDDYLDLCEQEGIEPEKPFKGSFNVRPGSGLHRRVVMYAREKGKTLNQVVKDALEKYLEAER